MSVPIVDPRIAAAGYSDDPIQKKLQIDELKKHISGGVNKDKQLREACEGFEAVFIQKIWEQMRNTLPKEGYLHSRDEEMYQSMFDTEFSKKMASAGGIGLADVLYEQLNIKLGKASRATSPSMFRNQQEIKGIDQSKGIELEPRYGSLKRDPETEMALNAGGKSDPNGIYNEFKEDGLEYINPYTRAGFDEPAAMPGAQPDPGRNAATAEAAAEPATGPAADPAAPQPPEQGIGAWQRNVYGLGAYMGNLQYDVNAVGSIGAARAREAGTAEAGGAAPMGIGAKTQNAQPGLGQAVKFVDSTAPGGLNQAPLGQGDPAGQISGQNSVQAAQPDIPGFAGMKPPFSGIQIQANQTPIGYNLSNIAGSMLPGSAETLSREPGYPPAASGDAAAPSAGMSQSEPQPGNGMGNVPGTGAVSFSGQFAPAAPTAPTGPSASSAVTPAAEQTAQTSGAAQAQTQPATVNSIPDGMFRRFDTLPEM